MATTAKSSMDTSKIVANKNDILLGRGGKNNQHSGNEQLRKLALSKCELYKRSTKKGKATVAMEIVYEIRRMKPPGRFLKKDVMGNWIDVGDHSAKEKVGQVLRDALVVRFGRVGWTSDSATPTESVDVDVESASSLATPKTTKKRPTKKSSSSGKKKPVPSTPDTSDESYTDEPSGMVEAEQWRPPSKLDYRPWSQTKRRHVYSVRSSHQPDPFATATMQEMASRPIQYATSPLQASRKRHISFESSPARVARRQHPFEASPNTKRQYPFEASPSAKRQYPFEASPSAKRQYPFESSPVRGTKRRFDPYFSIPTPPRVNGRFVPFLNSPPPPMPMNYSYRTSYGSSDTNVTHNDQHLNNMFDFEFNSNDPIVDGSSGESNPSGFEKLPFFI